MKKIIAIFLTLAAGSANAAYITGNVLFDELTSSETIAQVSAMSYIFGVADSNNQTKFCIPDGVTGRQLKDIVLRKLMDNPSQRHYAAHSIAVIALRETFPCGKR